MFRSAGDNPDVPSRAKQGEGLMMRVLPAVVVGLLTALPTFGQQEPPDAAIHAMVEAYVRAFNAGDAEAAAATYTPNGTHTYILGFTHHGRAEIAQGLRELLAGPLKGARISIESLRITALTPTVAVEEEAFSLEGLTSPDGQAGPPLRGLCLVTHQYLDGQWLAAAVQCMVPPPAATTE